VLAPDQRSDLK